MFKSHGEGALSLPSAYLLVHLISTQECRGASDVEPLCCIGCQDKHGLPPATAQVRGKWSSHDAEGCSGRRACTFAFAFVLYAACAELTLRSNS